MNDLKRADLEQYKQMRDEIIQYAINTLEHHSDDDFITEKVLDMLGTVVKKCYIMVEPKQLF